MVDVSGIVVAAGGGERFRARIPKAFVELNGRALLVHAAEALAAAESIRHLVVVVPIGMVERGRQVLGAAGVEATVCEGGPTRQESVSAGLACCDRASTIVAVHDAARPLVTPRLVDRTVTALLDPWDAAAPGLPVVDTLKLVDAARFAVLRTVDRQGMWAVQTPQVFRRSTLERVHARVASAADAATDDLSLVERAGGRVRLIEGDRRNFKITFPEDLALADAVLRFGEGPPR